MEEIPITRKELGYPPLVTPMSQMIGSQSVSNILFGRYEMVSNAITDYVIGKYGRPPVQIEESIKTIILKDEKNKVHDIK
jgi:pyruvate/oxaloacetate carboxyltransferase